MILSVHFLVGAVIAQKFSNPILGLSFAFISHYFVDFLPHWQYSVKSIYKKLWQKSFFDFLKIFLDISLGALFVFIFSKNIFWALAGGFSALLPDFFSFLFLIFPKNVFIEKHYRFHINKINLPLNKKCPVLLGFLVELSIAILAIFFLRQG